MMLHLIFSVSGHGRPRKHSIPDTLSSAAETILAGSTWKKVSWRRGTKGRLAARFAAVRIRIADGSPQRILDKGQRHMPGEGAWLVGEWRSNDERKYYLSNLPAETALKELAAVIKARWVCEQAHQQMKEELGLDHFEGGLSGILCARPVFVIDRRISRRRRRRTGSWPRTTRAAVVSIPRPRGSAPSIAASWPHRHSGSGLWFERRAAALSSRLLFGSWYR
jgi:hypothetical protein